VIQESGLGCRESSRGLTELVAEDLDRIMGGCDEGLPWQSVAEQLGTYWFQLASCKDLSDADRSSLLSLLSKWIPQLANYGLDDYFSQAIQVLQKRPERASRKKNAFCDPSKQAY
jgi:hypothetical protein